MMKGLLTYMLNRETQTRQAIQEMADKFADRVERIGQDHATALRDHPRAITQQNETLARIEGHLQ
jgi:phage shock protein A